MIELTDQSESEPKQIVSQLQTLKVDEPEQNLNLDSIEEYENENKDESVCSMDMKQKFLQLDLNVL